VKTPFFNNQAQLLSFMVDWNRIWRIVLPIVLIVAVLATTMGMAFHVHHDRYAADQCTLCHLVIAPAAVNADVCEFAPISADCPVQSDFLISRCVSDQIPSRSPPA
jgi:hypothetical protein